MKKTLTLFTFLFFFCVQTYAQIYEIDALNGQTATTCGGTFYDSGGAAGFYVANENFTVTFCPNATNLVTTVNFTNFSLGDGDQLCVFSGSNTTAPSLGCFSSVNATFSVTSTAANGCLTFSFTSNAVNQGIGWVGNISCQVPCQKIDAVLQSSTPTMLPADTGYIDICEGGSIALTGQGLYSQNNTTYFQSDATSTFSWLIEGQTFTGQTINHTFNNSGGYYVQLKVTDTLGCVSNNTLNAKVRVAPPPTFVGTNAAPSTVCLGDTVTLNGVVNPGSESFATSLARGDSIYLPDGTGVCYKTTLEFTGFSPGQTLTNVNDFLGVCVNMEHSWIGDLDVFFRCPNGTTVTLHPFGAGGGSVKLGEPVFFNNSPGLGYDYCWTPTATQTWSQAIASGTGTTLVNGQQTLKSGNYAPNTPFSALVGCPLNGQWEIEICDNLGADDGYIFNWEVQFSPNVYPSIDTFSPVTVTANWEIENNVIVNGNTALGVPTSPGISNYTYSITDNFGCSHDTTIAVTVIGPPNPPTLSCASANATSVTIARTAVAQVNDYEINVNNTGWQPFNTATFTASGLNPAQPVFFQARSKGPIGCELYSIIDTITCSTLPCQLAVTLNSLTQVSCSGASDGTALVGATTNTQPLTFTLDNGTPSNSGAFNNLTFGLHTVVVEDGNTCQDSVTFNVTSPFSMNITTTTTPVLCHGDNTGTASASVSGGSPPYNFLWNNNDNTGAIIDLVAGTYTVSVTDNNNCTDTQSVIITEPTPLVLDFQKTDVSCFQGNDGTATAIPTGGVGNYTYQWTTFPVQTAATATNLIANNYTVTVTDGNNCTIIGDTNILQPALLVVSVDTNRVTCFGTNDGEAISTVTGGTAPYTYLWSNGDTTPTVNNLSGGFHSLTVTDSLGCMTTTNFGIYEPPQIINNFTTTQVTCFGLSDGSATVTASGGVGNSYTYIWSNSANQQTGPTALNLGGGYHAVKTTDRENCSQTTAVLVFAPVLVFVDTMTSTVASCFDKNDGSAATGGSGGSGGLSYKWSNNATTSAINNLYRGQYTVTISDAFGCIGIDSIVVGSPDSLEILFATTPLFCGSDGTGTASASVLGGVSPYSYAWGVSPINTTTSLSGLQAGQYVLTITDAQNCLRIDTATVTEPDPLLATTTYIEPLCFGDANGSARIFPTGGNNGYTFSWATNPAQTDTTAVGLATGTYLYTVVDSNNCTYTDSVVVTQPDLLTSLSVGTNITCRDAADGVATVLPSGGSYPFSYTWSSSPLNDSIVSSLDTGWHYVTIVDFFGCTTPDSVYLMQPDYITSTITGADLSCFQSADGSATIAASGGVGGYTYLWSKNNQTAITATFLDAGWNFVTITDANNCTATDSVFLNEPPQLVLTSTSTPTLCHGESTGTATVVGTGGTGGYTYLWNTSPSQVTATATNLSKGIYTATVTDALNCSVTINIAVTEPNPLGFIFSKTDMSCFEKEDGTITVTASGGTGGYFYNWNNTETTATIDSLDKGIYAVTVTDANGCNVSNSIEIIEPTLLVSAVVEYPTSCFGGADGRAVAAGSGGTPNADGSYNYLWTSSLPQMSDSAILLTGGLNYTVYVTDANGCRDTNNITIGQPDDLVLTATATVTNCDYSADGSAIVTHIGGTFPFKYLWDADANSQTLATATGLLQGNYFVTVTDANGCQKTTNAVVTAPEPIKILATAQDIACKGATTGELSATTSGGTFPYGFLWDNAANNQNTPIATNLSAGIYTVTVTDSLGCVGIDSFEVAEPANYLQTTLLKSDITCFGERNGEITISTTGGSLPYAFSMDNDSFSAATVIPGLFAGQYFIYTKDANGCTDLDSIEIVEPAPFSAFLPFDTTIEAGTDIEIVPVLDNGVPPFVYEWQPQDSTLSCWSCANPTALGLLYERKYRLKVTDANGCAYTDDIVVRVRPNRNVYIATGFSPNNDNVNDWFFVQGGIEIKTVHYFKVYNRWGELMFANENFPINKAEEGWDGYFKGERAPSSTYGWVTEVEFVDGERRILKGNTTLIW